MLRLTTMIFILSIGLNPLATAVGQETSPAQNAPPAEVASVQNWQQWRSPQGKFTVLAPGSMRESIQVLFPDPELDPQRKFATGVVAHVLSATEDNNSYQIYYFDVENLDQLTTPATLEMFFRSFKQSFWIDGEIQDIQVGTHSGKEAHLLLRYDGRRGVAVQTMRYFAIGKRLYFVSGSSSCNPDIPCKQGIEAIDRFIGSFRFF